MKVRIAAVQPRSYPGDDEEKNVEVALSAIREAADRGAQIVCLPEGYPGPWLGRKTFPSLEPLGDEAKRSGVYVVAGLAEEAERPNHFFTTEVLIGPNGEEVGRYRRVQAAPQAVYDGLTPGKVMGFGRIGGDDLPVFETEFGKIGILACSELYCPELCRILALRGADIVFFPVGGVLYELFETWKTLIWARAIENLVYTVSCQHVFGKERGIARITSPEEVLGALEEEGILVCEVDLSRLAWLREHDEGLVLPKPYKTLPGLLRWRRPELYGELLEATSGQSTPSFSA